jgi:ribokinase
MGKHIVSIGDLVLDITMPVALPIRPGNHQDTSVRKVEPGGAANFMIAARHMGLDVSAAGTVGVDAFGKLILDALRDEGVDTSHIVTVTGSTSTLVFALTDQASGEHTFVGHYGEGPEVPYPRKLDKRIARSDALFVSGYSLFEERVLPMALQAVEQAVAQKVPIYLDAGPYLEMVPPDQVRWIIERVTVIMMTEEEVPSASGGLSGEEAYTRLLDQGPGILVVKQGPAGCTIVTPEGVRQVPGFNVPVVDTVGAGDCFDAAFIAGLLSGLDLWACGRLANAMGAVAVQKIGAGRSAPTCAEVLAVLREAGEEIDFRC